MIARLVLRRLASLPPLLLVVSFLIFAAVRALPGDPARLMAGPQASSEAVAALRTHLGLDDPLPAQYLRFLGHALRGDFGISIATKTPVTHEIGTRLPYTLALAGLSYLLALAVGLPAGMWAASRRGGRADHLFMLGSAIAASLASFWVALMAMELFAVRLHWLPLLGAGTWPHYVMPTIVLAIFPAALVARMTRAGMIGVLGEDYIRTARAKGLSPARIAIHHALPNAMLPIVTIVALNLGSLIGGAIVTETVFSWPGVGRLLVDAVRMRDYPVVQGEALLAVLAVVLSNLAGEVVIMLLNARIRSA